MKRSLITNGLLVVAVVLLALNLVVQLMQATPASYAAAGKIQYKFVGFGRIPVQQVEAELNKYGAEGWELIMSYGENLIFKK